MLGHLAALVAAGGWAVASFVYTPLGRRVGALQLNLAKNLLATAALGLTLVWMTAPPLDAVSLGWLALSGVLGIAVGDTAFFMALATLGPRRTLLVETVAPPLTALLAWVVLGEALSGRQVAAIGLTCAGIAWVVTERVGSAEGETRLGVGLAWAGLAALCQAGGSVLLKLGGEGRPGLQIAVVRVAAGAVGLALVLGWRGRWKQAAPLVREPKLALALVGACAVGTYGGLWLQAVAMTLAPVGIASALLCTSPLFALPLAWVVSGERISWRAAFGAVVAVGGVALAIPG